MDILYNKKQKLLKSVPIFLILVIQIFLLPVVVYAINDRITHKRVSLLEQVCLCSFTAEGDPVYVISI